MSRALSLDGWIGRTMICLAIAAATTMIHVKAVDLPNREFQAKWHEAVIAGHAPAPDQYRVLTFAAAEGLRRLTGADLLQVYAGLRFALTAAGLLVFFGYLRYWFGPTMSCMGVLLVGAGLPITFFGYKMQPTDPAQFLFFVLVFRALQTDSHRLLYLIAPLAVANRESALLLIPFCAAAWWGRASLATVLVRTGGLLLAMLAVLAPVHLYYGSHGTYAPVFTLLLNLGSPRSLLFPGLLIGWGSIAAITGLRRKPELLRRWVLPAALFVGVHLFVAKLDEARLLLPILPVVVPLALFSVGDASSDIVEQSLFATVQ